MSGNHPISRMIELGPSKTLTGMGQKTAQRQVASGEKSADSAIEFLASTQNTKELLYQYDAATPLEEEVAANKIPAHLTITSQQSSGQQVVNPVSISTAASSVNDVPLQSTDCVRALVARKLKKSVCEISNSLSIKELCGGRVDHPRSKLLHPD